MRRLSGNDFLDTAQLKENLRTSALHGGMVTGGIQVIKFVLRLGSVAVMGRLLTPDDYGLIGMVIAVTSLIALFKDLGLSIATIQRDKISHQQISTLFWINIGFSVILMLATIAVAPFVAAFYKEPSLVAITIALSFGFLFSGASVQHLSLLKRQIMFMRIAFVQILSAVSGIVVGILLAWYGAGYWAIVWMLLTFEAATTAGVWLMCTWRPGLPARHSGVRSMLAFGGNLTGFNFVNYFARNIDDVLIGKLWGQTSLGYYDRAYKLLLTPLQQVNEPISGIAIPTLSRLQDNPEKFRHYYCQALKLIAFITMPVIAVIGVLAHEITFILLGRNWVLTGTIFAILAPAAFIQPILSTTGWVYISLGQTKRLRNWGSFFSGVQILAIIIGISWGATGVAAAYTVATYLVFIPALAASYHLSSVTLASAFRAIWRPMTASIFTGVAVYAVHSWGPAHTPIRVTSLCIGAATACYVIQYLLWSGLRNEVLELVSIIKSLRKK